MQQISTEPIEEEIWKDIIGYEGHYQISNQGRVKALGRKGSGCCVIDRIKKVTKSKDKTHYDSFGLCVGNKSKCFMLHRVLAIHFIPNPENKKEVNHIDGNKSNNSLENLEWVTASENIYHGLKLGIMNTANGLTKSNVRFSKQDVIEIKKRIKNGDLGAHIANDYGVNKVLIYNIKSGKTWKYITI